jgi:hypothetical protein
MTLTVAEARSKLEADFRSAGIPLLDLRISSFPEETIFVVKVPPSNLSEAVMLGNEIDRWLASADFSGFVTVRPSDGGAPVSFAAVKRGVQDERAAQLIQLLTTRARTSERHPSLSYVPDVRANVTAFSASRHHLVFGRRGAGKTSLMLEGRNLATAAGDHSVWINVQTHRWSRGAELFLWAMDQLCTVLRGAESASQATDALTGQLQDDIAQLLSQNSPDEGVRALLPRVQNLLARFADASGGRVLLFLDDFHYMARSEQPVALDLLHGAVRDTDTWIKIAAIRHLTKWWDSERHLGLQTVHDADHINLDVTLQDPGKAKEFLEEVLRRYANNVGIATVSGLFSPDARDRLVLSSGAVPRDYLTLCSRAIARARTRTNPKLVGVQDVNNAAGDAAATKIEELEEDLATNEQARNLTLEGLQYVRRFCLEERSSTYFRVTFEDKEHHPEQYEVLSSLLDVRLLHLLDPSLSDPHRAGLRSEVYMLDLSQFSGQRLKHFLRVLDLEHGHFVSKVTRRGGKGRVGDTPLKLITILRAAPVLRLSSLPLVDSF